MRLAADGPPVLFDAESGLADHTPGLPDYRAPRTFQDLTTAEQSLLRPPAWLPPCRHEHRRTASV